jgi:GNAT superfamily N-acetyltransferase
VIRPVVARDVLITPYRPELAAAFDRLNRAWITRLFTLEPRDEAHLAHPEGHIIARGGEIFFALEGGHALGTCAAIPAEPGVVELAKLAVDPAARGRGVGRALAEAAIGFARSRQAHRVMLVSNSRLVPALRLYASLGFRERPFPGPSPCINADVYMELELAPTGSALIDQSERGP